jgi:hypothetical protein
MAAHWEHTDDLFVYKEFLKPIEIDDCKIMPCKYQEEKRYERRLKIKNVALEIRPFVFENKSFRRRKEQFQVCVVFNFKE